MPGVGLAPNRMSVRWLFSFPPALNQTSFLSNCCRISNHIPSKSQNNDVQIKAPLNTQALVCYNSVTCHLQGAL